MVTSGIWETISLVHSMFVAISLEHEQLTELFSVFYLAHRKNESYIIHVKGLCSCKLLPLQLTLQAVQRPRMPVD